MKERLQPNNVYFKKHENKIKVFIHDPNSNKTVKKSLKFFWGKDYSVQTDTSFWNEEKRCFREYSDKKGKCPIKSAQTDNSRLKSLYARITSVLDNTECYTPEDLYTAYNAAMGVCAKTSTVKQYTLLEYAEYCCKLWESGEVRGYAVKSANAQTYSKLVSKLKGTKYRVTMPWANKAKQFAQMPITNITNDTYKAFCMFVASYSDPKAPKTNMGYECTVKAFRAVVYRFQREENNNPDFKFTFNACSKDMPKPQHKDVGQTLSEEQLKELFSFDVTRILPRRNKAIKQLYLDTCILMYKQFSRPYDIISMRIEDISTDKDGNMFWGYCPKKKANLNYDNPRSKYAEVRIHKDCIDIIKKYKGNRTNGYLLPFPQNEKETTYSRSNDVMHIRESIRQFLRDINDLLQWGIDGISMYNLRHSVITNAMNKEMDIEKIAIAAKTSVQLIRKTYADINEISRRIDTNVI